MVCLLLITHLRSRDVRIINYWFIFLGVLMLRFILLHALNHYDICIYICIYICISCSKSFKLIVFYIIYISYTSIYLCFFIVLAYELFLLHSLSFCVYLPFTAQMEIPSRKIVNFLWTEGLYSEISSLFGIALRIVQR